MNRRDIINLISCLNATPDKYGVMPLSENIEEELKEYANELNVNAEAYKLIFLSHIHIDSIDEPLVPLNKAIEALILQASIRR